MESKSLDFLFCTFGMQELAFDGLSEQFSTYIHIDIDMLSCMLATPC